MREEQRERDEKLLTEVTGLRKENAALLTETVSLRTEVTGLKTENVELRTERTSLKRRIDESENEQHKRQCSSDSLQSSSEWVYMFMWWDMLP
jgi:regulator of replication initiation timing